MTNILQKLPCPLHDVHTIVTSPHKMYGASINDMILQLRQHRIEKIILAGPVGNLCVEAHRRDFIEHGFEVAMVGMPQRELPMKKETVIERRCSVHGQR